MIKEKKRKKKEYYVFALLGKFERYQATLSKLSNFICLIILYTRTRSLHTNDL